MPSIAMMSHASRVIKEENILTRFRQPETVIIWFMIIHQTGQKKSSNLEKFSNQNRKLPQFPACTLTLNQSPIGPCIWSGILVLIHYIWILDCALVNLWNKKTEIKMFSKVIIILNLKAHWNNSQAESCSLAFKLEESQLLKVYYIFMTDWRKTHVR